MATFNIVLMTARSDRQGRAPLWQRITDASQSKTKSLGEKIKPSHWNGDKQVVRASHPDAGRINDKIATAKSGAAAETRRRTWEKRDLSAAAIADALWGGRAAGPQDFFAFADAWTDRLLAQDRIGYWKRARSVLKKLRATVGGPLPFSSFTSEVLEAHDRRMADELGNAPNTRVVAFRLIRTVVRRAIKDGVMEPWDDPFIRFTPPKETATDRGKLTVEEVDALFALELEEGSELDRTRDLYLFALYAAGVRFGDVASLRWSNVHQTEGGHRLRYRMSKTNAEKDLKLNARALSILGKYRGGGEPDGDALVFPLLSGYDLSTAKSRDDATSSRNVVVNRNLKVLAKLADVRSHLTFHTSRHTFADLARRNGADVYKVSKALGHSNLKVTTRYLAGFDSNATDDAIDTAFG